MGKLLTISEACKFAKDFTKKDISESNISYLIQYGRIEKIESNGSIYVDCDQLVSYYSSTREKRESEWKNILGKDINWALSFDQYKEAETTKHIHRLHPYKGKFIPQLVEYFLDEHTDSFKKEVFFKKGDIVLDPFCGSGTTLVQANELGIHAIGVDVSSFNAQISNCKVENYNLPLLQKTISTINEKLEQYENTLEINQFNNELLKKLYEFNTVYFPSPEFRRKVYNKEIDEKKYSQEKSAQFLPTFISLAKKHNISLETQNTSFMDTWFFETTRKEIYFVNDLINQVEDEVVKNILQIILSRTMRSCRATTHSDLATLITPIYTTYYCTKHMKICKPLFSILKWWKTYSQDTFNRIAQFKNIRTDTIQKCFAADSATADISLFIRKIGGAISEIYSNQKIKGIFCSPPYVGLIDYHEQHAYSYELFGLKRKDDLEIGSLHKGHTRAAQLAYINDISAVLLNCKKYLAEDYEVFIVANDKYGLYDDIASKSGMQIVDKYRRPVLNRTEKDKNAYSETIFRMKEKK